MENNKRKIIVAVTGASGAIYAEKLLISDDIEAERLADRRKYETNINGLNKRLNELENKVIELEKTSRPL
jgi:3-polyprenyl-4-hydroxybenzoate decarboxylase